MSRIEFDGKGQSIPKLALPPFASETDIPQTVLVFNEDTNFSVLDYQTLGFTHYEAWCVGAAGGRGGDSTVNASAVVDSVMRPVPQDVWNLEREYVMYRDFWAQNTLYHNTIGASFRPFPPPVLNREYWPGTYQGPVGTVGWATDPQNHASDVYRRWSDIIEHEFQHVLSYVGPSGGLEQIWPNEWLNWRGTYLNAFDYHNPMHLKRFRTYLEYVIWPSTDGMGGGGGGGGLHKTAGALADLNDHIPITVGRVGNDAPIGQTWQLGISTPDMVISYRNPATESDPYRRRQIEIENWFASYLTSYPNKKGSFDNPAPGADGGASSFGDACQASGGKGGAPGKIWDGSKFILKGDGGEGGTGGRTLAGGGALGSKVDGVNGLDGVWLPDTGIGKGGGGGKGGSGQILATAGGQGSFSYADTTVYGLRQFRQPWTYIKPVFTQVAGPAPYFPITETVAYVPTTESNKLVVPGGGGGARPASNMKYGGRGIGFSPNGVVILRLVKIT